MQQPLRKDTIEVSEIICHCPSQGSFLRTDFSFKVYYPATRDIQDSQVKGELDRSAVNISQSMDTLTDTLMNTQTPQQEVEQHSSKAGTLESYFGESVASS